MAPSISCSSRCFGWDTKRCCSTCHARSISWVLVFEHCEVAACCQATNWLIDEVGLDAMVDFRGPLLDSVSIAA